MQFAMQEKKKKCFLKVFNPILYIKACMKFFSNLEQLLLIMI